MTTLTISKNLKPYKCKTPKREVRKPKSLYETILNLNRSTYTQSSLTNFIKLIGNISTLKTVETPKPELVELMDKACEMANNNHVIVTGSLRMSGLESNESKLCLVVIHKLPKFNFKTDENEGFEYKIQYLTSVEKETQLGQFAKRALISGCEYINHLNTDSNIKENVHFTVFTNSKSNHSLMNTNRLKDLYAESYKSVQNKELFHKMYLAKTVLSNAGYRLMDNDTLKILVETLES